MSTLKEIQKDISIDDIEEEIEKANTLSKINMLRVSCVKAMNIKPAILMLWQKRYWDLRRCPTCGKNR